MLGLLWLGFQDSVKCPKSYLKLQLTGQIQRKIKTLDHVPLTSDCWVSIKQQLLQTWKRIKKLLLLFRHPTRTVNARQWWKQLPEPGSTSFNSSTAATISYGMAFYPNPTRLLVRLSRERSFEEDHRAGVLNCDSQPVCVTAAGTQVVNNRDKWKEITYKVVFEKFNLVEGYFVSSTYHRTGWTTLATTRHGVGPQKFFLRFCASCS